MSERLINMPKYILICQNKMRYKYAGVLNMSDAVAYYIYPSTFRTLKYSEPEAFRTPINLLTGSSQWLKIIFWNLTGLQDLTLY